MDSTDTSCTSADRCAQSDLCSFIVSVVLQDSMAMTGGTAAALPMSNHTRERVTVAKLTLENFYSTLLTQHEEREMRYCIELFIPLLTEHHTI